MSAASELNIPSLFVETNCFWAASDSITRDKLLLLRERGLHGIMISVNPFYAEFVPFSRTRRAVRIGREVFGGNTMVYQLYYYEQFTRMGLEDRLDLNEYMRERGEELAISAEFFLSGRAPYGVEEYGLFPHLPAQSFFTAPCLPEPIRSWHNHYDSDGNIIPGYCGGITLGSVYDLDRIIEEGIDLDERPALSLILNDDFEGLLDHAAKRGYVEREKGYLSKCHLCVDIRKHLWSIGGYPALAPEGFYRFLEDFRSASC